MPQTTGQVAENILTSGGCRTSATFYPRDRFLPPSLPPHPSHLVANHRAQDVSRRYHPLRHGLQPRHSCPRPRLRIRTVISIPPFLSPPRCPSSNQTKPPLSSSPEPSVVPRLRRRSESILLALSREKKQKPPPRRVVSYTTVVVSCCSRPALLVLLLRSSGRRCQSIRKRDETVPHTSALALCGLASGKSPVNGAIIIREELASSPRKTTTAHSRLNPYPPLLFVWLGNTDRNPKIAMAGSSGATSRRPAPPAADCE